MRLTTEFRETVRARAKRDPAFREGLFIEAVENLSHGEIEVGKNLLREYVSSATKGPRHEKRAAGSTKNNPDAG